MKLISKDPVGLLKQLDRFGRDLAEDAHGQARARKRMTLEDHFGNAEIAADRAHFVFEKFTQRLDQLEMHLFGQSADVVMCLDRDRRSTKTDRLDNVGVESALNEPFDVTDVVSFSLKDINEFCADRFSFLFRIGNTSKHIVKLTRRVGTAHIQMKVVVVNL